MGEHALDLDDMMKSGVYAKGEFAVKDLVYGTSDGFFFWWLNEKGFGAVNWEPEVPLTPRARYDILKFYEVSGGSFDRVEKEWSEFERRMLKK